MATEDAVSLDEVERFARDGVVVLRGVFAPEWVETLARGVARNLAEPGPLAKLYTADGAPGFFFGDYCNWRRISEYRAFAEQSPAAAIAARLMGASKVNLFHEHVLVKEPGTRERTPWHHDQPYWTVDGWQVCSLWLPLDAVPRETAVEFVAGSHRWGAWYTPKRFYDGENHPTNEGEQVPDIDAARGDYEIVGWAMAPGDCLAFHARTLHGAPGNVTERRRRAVAFRFTGDDARFARRDGLMSPPFEDVTLAPGALMDSETFPVVWRGR